jgi:hypothetical protein
MSVYKKLQEARIKLQNTELKKSGHNKFAGYKYFELGDFLPSIQKICDQLGLCGVVSFNHEMAFLQIIDTEDGTSVMFTSPMSSAALKGCHDVQNLGAVQTYLRRYLWVNAFEIVEHDALDATMGSDAPKKPEAVVAKPAPKVAPVKATSAMVTAAGVAGTGKTKLPGEWTLKPVNDKGTAEQWMEEFEAGCNVLLEVTAKEEDVLNIFTVNRPLFDKAKELDKAFYDKLMAKFTVKRKSFKEEK